MRRVGTLTTEIVNTVHSRAVGLMHRSHLPQRHSMTFVYDDPCHPVHWNANVPFDLDLLCCDDGGTVREILHLSAHQRDGVRPSEPCSVIVEVNAGVAMEMGIRPGETRVRVSGGLLHVEDDR